MPVPPHVAFDIETTGIDIDDDAITCAATREVTADAVALKLWHSDFAPAMTAATLAELVDYLAAADARGLAIVTFNGAKFDFAMVARKLPSHAPTLRRLARSHHDLMFQFTAHHGYYASMASFAAGCELAPKTWDGAAAAEAWAHGDLAAKRKVLDYCGEDVRCLSDLYAHVAVHKRARRRTKRNTLQTVEFATLMTVEEAAAHAAAHPPDTSWMSDPPDLFAGVKWLAAV
jgi:uncharacterized protein YprB with RNaseH-like and TPR domain